ncbi:FAD-dependent oxidoreductase [Paenibacillus hemerocallicola]|uniref:FAD-dependent oxidoreductase n=1 Tax=Paenibacillus hemerocallicola TaxID=1172614 RepID=UPI001C408B5E|nr:FAD-dependent oxidoreductase [Paenibacillus hemerocallicola]
MTNFAETVNVSRKTAIAAEADVLVVGGGPAGIGAAIAAARKGARTVLVERYGFLGGNATASLVGPFMTSFSDDGQTQLIKGVFDELVRRMERLDGAVHPEKVRNLTAYAGYRKHGHDHVTPFDPEVMKLVAMEMMEEAGVRLFLHTFLVDAIREGDRVAGVLIASKSGLQAIRANVVVDCSADGDVAYRAGVPMKTGRASDGLTQPMTLFFRMANIDDDAVDAYRAEHPEEGERLFAGIIDRKRESGEWTVARDKVAMYKTPQDGVWRFNITRIQQLDGTSVEDLTRAELDGRRQVFQLVRFFRDCLPGFERAILIDTAAQVGVRETRRITGEYELTLDDLIAPTAFPDVIALCGYPVDIHSPTGAGGGCTDEFPTANAYEIPYRSLVPVGLDNLLVAGRCISATHEALSAVRVMPPCFAMGQAAGVAAALCAERGTAPRRVDVNELQSELLKQNAYLGARFAAV